MNNDLRSLVSSIIENLSIVPDLCEEIVKNPSNLDKGEELIKAVGNANSGFEDFKKNIVELLHSAESKEPDITIQTKVMKNGLLIERTNRG